MIDTDDRYYIAEKLRTMADYYQNDLLRRDSSPLLRKAADQLTTLVPEHWLWVALIEAVALLGLSVWWSWPL